MYPHKELSMDFMQFKRIKFGLELPMTVNIRGQDFWVVMSCSFKNIGATSIFRAGVPFVGRLHGVIPQNTISLRTKVITFQL
jgi:hypothetical protein